MEWPKPSLLSVAELVSDRIRPFTGERLYVDTGSVGADGTIRNHVPITFDSRPARADIHAQAGDVLFARMRGTIKVLQVSPANMAHVFSTGFAVLRPQPDVLDSRYLFHFLRTPLLQEEKDRLSGGAIQPAINNDGIARLSIPLPSLSEQRRIVEILDQVDHLRHLRAEADAKADRTLPALYISMFGDPTTNPRGWPTSPLSSLARHITSGSRGWAKYAGRGQAFFVRTQDVQDGEISPDLLPIAPPPGAESERTRLLRGDVVVTITGVVGKAAVVRESARILHVSQHVALVRPDPDCIRPEFLASYANLPLSDVPVLARFQYGQTKPGLGFRELRTASVPLPPIDLQERFSKLSLKIRGLRHSGAQARSQLNLLWRRVLGTAYAGSLTASWRRGNMGELLEEMEHQARRLGAG